MPNRPFPSMHPSAFAPRWNKFFSANKKSSKYKLQSVSLHKTEHILYGTLSLGGFKKVSVNKFGQMSLFHSRDHSTGRASRSLRAAATHKPRQLLRGDRDWMNGTRAAVRKQGTLPSTGNVASCLFCVVTDAADVRKELWFSSASLLNHLICDHLINKWYVSWNCTESLLYSLYLL